MHKRRQKLSQLTIKKLFRVPILLVLGSIFTIFLILLRVMPNREINTEKLESFDDYGCTCWSKKHGEYDNFCYIDPQNSSSIGKKFECGLLDTLYKLELIGKPTNAVKISDSLKYESEVIFVSATSDDHFNYSLKSLESIRKFYPYQKYILYGLNLSTSYVNSLPKDEKLEFRQFNSSCYPNFVNNWKYHFKGLILAEVLREFPIIWWIDANMKMIKPDVISKLFKEIASKRISDYYSSLISFRETDHSNFDVLHPDLLSYFPSDSIQLLQQERQIGPGNMFVVRTKYTLKIVKWWVLCSLTENCMNPPGSQLKCHFDKSRERLHANCYRYDQSVVNLLLLNDFKKIEKYLMRSLINSFERIH